MKMTIYSPGEYNFQQRRFGPTVTIEATPFLMEDEPLELNQEVERARWEWVVDDLPVVLSDKDRTFTDAFATINKQTHWWVDFFGDTWDAEIEGAVPSPRLLFQGMIDPPSVSLKPLDRTVGFTALPLQRFMWDRLANIKCRRVIAEAEDSYYLSLEEFLRRELITVHQLNADRLISDVVLGEEWENRVIRDSAFYTTTALPPILGNPATRAAGQIRKDVASGDYPNAGMFRFIDPSMTWADLMQQLSVYYNALFYIEQGTRHLKIRTRLAPTSTDVRILDTMLSEKVAPEILPVDDQQLDYAGMYMQMEVPAPTLLSFQLYEEDENVINTIRLPAGTVGWAISATVDGKEYLTSKPLIVDLFDFRAPGFVTTYGVTMKIGAGPSETQKRSLYRFHSTAAHLGYRWLRDIPGNDVIDITDEDPLWPWIVDAAIMPDLSNNAKAWMRYTTEYGWAAPILDPNGNNTPGGAVLDITPKIQFTDHTSEDALLELDGERIFEFFGSEMTPEQFQGQYKDLFLTKRRVICQLKGTDYRIGDPVMFKRLHGIQGADLIVRKARNLMYERETAVELLER